MSTFARDVSALTDEVVAELRGKVDGAVLTAAESANGDVRAVYNAMHEGTPGVTVVASGTDDVVAAVKFAREHGLLLAVRGGGHSVAGLSTIEGGMLIDLARMNAVEGNPEKKLAVAQGGAVWADIDNATQAHGLVAPGGVVSDTGIAGLTLGGGYGWLRCKLGLSCDSLIEAEVVTADGAVVTASESENADLFWALRGGGGNFGVVTSFTFKLHELGPDVAFSAVLYPLEDIGQVLEGWHEFMKTAPDEVTSVVVTLTFPANPDLPAATHDRPVAIVGAVYVGDAEEGLALTKPLRELAEPVFDMSGPTPYVDVQTSFDPLFPRGELRNYWKSLYLSELTPEALDTIAARALDRPSARTMVNTFAMGGQIAAVDPEATAFSARSAPWLVSLDGVWSSADEDATVVGWIRDTFAELSEYGTGEVYLNFTGLSEEAPSAGVDSAFGRNLKRLGEVKAKYDPDNFFRVNNNIAPASS